MPYGVPNLANAAFGPQAELDSGDLEILVRGLDRIGVVSGGLVSTTGAANGSVSVEATVTLHNEVRVAVTATTMTIPANTTANPRFDLIGVSTLGTVIRQVGVESSVPTFPAVPTGVAVLAVVYVPAGHTATTTVPANTIVDKRVLLRPRQFTVQTMMTAAAAASATLTFPASPHLEFMAYVSGYASNGIFALQLGTTATPETTARYWHRNHPSTNTATATWGTAVQAASASMLPLASNAMLLGRMCNGSIGNPNGTSHPVAWQTANASGAVATVALSMVGYGEYVSTAAGRVISARLTTTGGNLLADTSLSISGIAGWI